MKPDENAALKGSNGLLLTLIFFVVMAFWTLFFLFVIPDLQKKFFISGSLDFIEFQAGYGFFTIFGYFCFVLLVVTWLAVLFTPGYKNTKGLGIFISILLLFSLLGVAESICSYSYLTKDGAVIRKFFSTGEKNFSWDDVKKVKISLYNTSAKPKSAKSEMMVKAVIIFSSSYDIVIRESVSGEWTVLNQILQNIKNNSLLEIGNEDREEWNVIRKDHTKR